MAKPTSLPEWATDGGADIVEPATGEKQTGWSVNDRPPAGWLNWWKNLTYLWLAWLDEKFVDGSTGTRVGAHGIDTTAVDTNGSGITATGDGTGPGVDGYGQTGARGEGTAYGIHGKGDDTVGGIGGYFEGEVDQVGVYAKATDSNNYALVAEAVASDPERAAVRIVAQSPDPYNNDDGAMMYNSQCEQFRGFVNGNWIGFATVVFQASNWSEEEVTGSYTQTLYAVVWGSTQDKFHYVAVGGSGGILISENGHGVWGLATPDGSYADDFRCASYSDYNDLYCIGGEGGEIQTSPDGETWTNRTPANSFTGWIMGMAYSPDSHRTVFVGQNGEIQTSDTGGTTWTHRAADDSYSGQFYCATYGNGLFVIAGSAGEIQTSSDGITWTHRTPAGSYSGIFRSVAYGNGVFVLGTASGEYIQYSFDGITWYNKTTPDDFGVDSSDSLYAVTYGNGMFVLIGTENHKYTNINVPVFVSPDGINWEVKWFADRASSQADMYGICYGDKEFIAVGQFAEIQRSLKG